jgi:exonuclease III
LSPPHVPIRLLTWNIQHGGGARRTPWIALALVEARADIVVLTEFRPARGGQIRAALADHRLEHQALSGPADGANAVLLASRWPLETPAGFPGAGPAQGRVLEARIPTLDLHIVGTHIPPPAPGVERARVWRHVLRAARAGRDGRRALLGDFNTGRAGPDGTSFRHTALLGQLSTLGYVDAWRRMHPDGRQMTWRGPAGAAARIDHCFLSEALAGRLTGARIEEFPGDSGDPGAPEAGGWLSDHAPVVVELAPEALKNRSQAVGSGPSGGPEPSKNWSIKPESGA